MESLMRGSNFLSTAAVFLCLLGVSGCQRDTPEESTEVSTALENATLIQHARIYTLDAANTVIADGAMAVSASGEILAVGETSVLQSSFPIAGQVDMEGRVILPGLIDAHGHLVGLALSLTRADLTGTTSKQEVMQRLHDFERTLGEDDWLLGEGWDQNDWPDKAFPTRDDLDREFSSRPVWLGRIDGHAAWGNSLALAQADRDFSGGWNPPGGLIHRDAGGQPTGIFVDRAVDLVEAVVPPVSEEALDAALGRAMENMLSLGLTGVHDPGVGLPDVRRYQNRIAAGKLPLRVYAMADGMGDTLQWLCDSGPLFDPSGRLVMRAVKLYADGALGSRAPHCSDWYWATGFVVQ
jgi:predicted amidohydrolase YtcJ